MDLTPEQAEAFEDLTDLQKRFAMKKLEGLSDMKSYQAAGGKATTRTSAETCASTVANHPKVKRFMQTMAAVQLKPSICTRDEILEFLSDIVRTRITDVADVVDEGTELIDPETGDIVTVAQSTWKLKDEVVRGGSGARAISELTAGKKGLTVKLHDARAAAKQLCEMLGYEAPKKTEITGKDGGPIATKEMSEEEFKAHLISIGVDPDAA